MTAHAFRPRLRDHYLCILVHQGLKRAVVRGVVSDRLDLVLGHLAADRLALLPALQVVVRPVLPLTDHAELAWLHALKVGDLLQKPTGGAGFVLHSARTIYASIYSATQFRGLFTCLLPAGVRPETPDLKTNRA